MNTSIEALRESSVRDMNAAKGIQQYMNAVDTDQEESVEKASRGYIVDSVAMQKDSPIYNNPKEEDSSIVDELTSEEIATPEGRKNQMAVLANTTSPEDYKQLQEDGFSLDDTDQATIVTVQDKIKANIAKVGGQVTGEVSEEALEELVGNSYLAVQMAAAMQQNDLPLTQDNVSEIKEVAEMMTDFEGLGQSEQLYLVKNQLKPTVENVYKASHSAGLPVQASEASLEGLQDQVAKIIENANLPVDQQSLQQAKDLLTNDIPLTPENLSYYADLGQLGVAANQEQQIQQTDVAAKQEQLIQQQTAVAAKQARLLLQTAVAGEISSQEDAGLSQVIETEFLAKQVTAAKKEGQAADKAMLLAGYSLTDQAESLTEELSAVTEEDLAYCIQNGKELNLTNLTDAAGHRGELSEEDLKSIYQQADFVKAQRVLEETRLMMTTEANLSMLKQGISIDTKPLEEVVDQLKTLEKNFYANLLENNQVEASDANVESFANTMDLLERMKSAPAAVLATWDVDETLNQLDQKASLQQESYEKAGQAYEKLWTAPRADMGDSIQKAFRNVDDILTDLSLDTSESNRRAVRILAYNETEINEENIETIKAKDEQMQRLFQNLTPRTTIELIRRGENPIDTPVEKLADQVEEIKTEIGDDGNERFEKFLYRLEKNKEISEEERSSYIGIYRLIAQVEKNDGAALGAAYEQGSEITMRSLLTQIRNSKKKNDYTIDDQFEGVTAKTDGIKIDRQIEAAFQNNCIKDVAEQVKPEDLKDLVADDAWMDMTPEQLKNAVLEGQQGASGQDLQQSLSEQEGTSGQMLQQNLNGQPNSMNQTSQSIEREMIQRDLSDMQAAAKSSQEVYEYLDRIDLPTTVNNVLAAEQLMAHPSNAISSLWNAKDALKEAKELAIERFGEAVKSPTELADALQTLEEVAEHCMDSMAQEAQEVSSIDLKSMQLTVKQMSIAASQAKKEESFLIPMETGEGVTGVSLKVVRSSGKKGLVDILFETASTGKVSASFEANADGIHGRVFCQDQMTREMFAEKLPTLAGQLAGEEDEAVDLSVVLGETGSSQTVASPLAQEETESYQIQTSRLYHIAKSFIEFAGELC